MLPPDKKELDIQHTQQEEYSQEEEPAQSDAIPQQAAPDSQQQEEPQPEEPTQSDATPQQAPPDSQQQEEPQPEEPAQLDATPQQAPPDSQQQEEPQPEEPAQLDATPQQAAPDSQQQEEPQPEEPAQLDATPQQAAPDSQQQERLQKARKVFQRWSQSLAASSSTLKKKAKASVEKAAKTLDKILPGESAEEARRKLLKAEEAKVLKEEIQPGMELANAYAAEIASVFGLQNVNVSSSDIGESIVVVSASYLDASVNFIGRIDDLGKPKCENISQKSIPFGSYRAIHEWIAAARVPEPWLMQILARAIMNVTGTTPSLTPIAPGTLERGAAADYATGATTATQAAIGPSASSIVPLSEERAQCSQILYKVESLSPQQREALRAFCASLTSPTEPRLRVPYQEVRLEDHGEDAILVLNNFPTGESACFPFIQEICALSLEYTPHFKAANSLLKAIIDCTTPPLSGGTPPPQFKILFDLVERRCAVQVPTELFKRPWTRCLLNYLYSKLGASASLVDTLPKTSNCCARNESIYRKHNYYEMCALATDGRGSMAIDAHNPEDLLPRLVKALQEALNKYQCTAEFCKLVPNAEIQPQLRSLCNASVGKIKAETAPLVMMVLNAETQDIIPNRPIFTHVHHSVDNWCSCEVSSDRLTELTQEGMNRVAQTAAKIPDIQANITIIAQEVIATLPLETEGRALFSLLGYSQTTIDGEHASTPAVKLSWSEQFLESGRKTKLEKDPKIHGVHCFDEGIVMQLNIFTQEWSKIQRLAEEIRRKLKIIIEEEKIPEPALPKSFLSKFTGKDDTPADKTATDKAEPGILQRFSGNVSSFFERSRSKDKATTPKKGGLPMSSRVRNMFIATAAAVVLAAIIYILIPLIPRLKNIPEALQAVGSILTGALISCIAYTCATKIQSDSHQRE
ncbi:hypothetical protein ACJZTR_01840 [Neorickettsia risticii]